MPTQASFAAGMRALVTIVRPRRDGVRKKENREMEMLPGTTWWITVAVFGDEGKRVVDSRENAAECQIQVFGWKAVARLFIYFFTRELC